MQTKLLSLVATFFIAAMSMSQGLKIGDGVVVGAGAVVTRDLPAMSICAGVPARVLGYRAVAREYHPIAPKKSAS